MKASDLSKVLSANPNDVMQNLLSATTAHNFERQVLDHCTTNAMDRVVTAIDYGSIQSSDNGIIDVLFFLVFELADGDLRKRGEKTIEFDLLWTSSAMHDLSVAVRQLHGGDIYHNDIKPANGLVFGSEIAKLADLGRATTPLFPVIHDQLQCAGDRRFAPPEQLYKLRNVPTGQKRFDAFRSGDLYNLGSIGHFLITGRSVTLEIIQRLRPEFRPFSLGGGWTDVIDEVLPHWSTLFSDLMEEMDDSVPEDAPESVASQYKQMRIFISSLCNPDVSQRGYPSQIGRPDQYDMQRYISSFDLMRKRLMVLQRHGN